MDLASTAFSSSGNPPKRRVRIAVAIGLGALCGIGSWFVTRLPGFGQQDFAVWWMAARAILHGQNPYTTIVGISGRPAFYHPLPAAIATIPLASLPATIAGPVFIGASCAALAYFATAKAWWPLIMFLSGSMLASLMQAQWAPLLTAGILAPALTWIGVVKPNIGLGMLAYRPSIRTMATMGFIGLASIAVRPTWPREWLASVSTSPFYFSPVQTTGGVVLLLALLKWRRPEARLLTVLAVLPSAPIPYEALPLFVIPQTQYEMMLLTILSDAMYSATMNLSAQHEMAAYYAAGRPAIVWLSFVPALLLVLRRPNEGDVPELVERFSQRLPRWLRGRSQPVASV